MPGSKSNSLRLLSFGAGAIGTYIGGSLALQGHAVTFLEKPAIRAELQQRGLRLKLLDREAAIPEPRLASSLEEALAQGPFDAGLFALKSYDTRRAMESLGGFAEALPPLLCLQNGVENELLLAEALGEGKVIAGTVTSAIGRHAAGDISLERLRGVGVAAGHPLSQRLVDAFAAAGLNARLYTSTKPMKWSKMLTNLLANATSAILDMTPAEIFAHSGMYQLEVEQLREALRVIKAQAIEVVDLPGTPVRALAFAVNSLPPGLSRPLLHNAVGSGRGGKMPSLHIDLKSGRGETEVDALNGAVVRYGERLGVTTPVNKLLNHTLQALASGERATDTYAHNPEKLLRELVNNAVK
jgi:2-dehydropantoate 2-reductase